MASDRTKEIGTSPEVRKENPKDNFDILVAGILEDKAQKHIAYTSGETITEERTLKTKNGSVNFIVRSYGKDSYSSIEVIVKDKTNAIAYTGEIKYEIKEGRWRFIGNDGKIRQDQTVNDSTAGKIVKSFQDIFIDAKIKNEVNLKTKKLLAQNFPEIYTTENTQA